MDSSAPTPLGAATPGAAAVNEPTMAEIEQALKVQLENALRRTILDHLARKTRESPRYEKSYGLQIENLKAAAEGRDLLPGWALTKDAPVVSDHPRVFAVDCEMAETKTDDSKLVRVSVVQYNWDTDMIEKKYDEVIKPEATDSFTDFRTVLHGLKPHEIFGAKTTFAEAQNFVLCLITKDAYIVGHSLDSDLKSLKIVHERVIDTANLFSIKTHPRRNLALRDLATGVLETDDCQPIGTIHDSTDDAAWALKVVLHMYQLIRKHEDYSFELERLPKRYMLELNIFGIPEAADHMAIMGLFPGCVTVHQRPIVFKTRPQDPRHKLGSTTFTFASEDDARRAFVQLPYMDYNQDAEGFWKKKTALFIKGRQFGVWVKTHDQALSPPASDQPFLQPSGPPRTLPLPPPHLAHVAAVIAHPLPSRSPVPPEIIKEPASATSTPGQSSEESGSDLEEGETQGSEAPGQQSEQGTPKKSKKKNKKNKKKLGNGQSPSATPSGPANGDNEVSGEKRKVQSVNGTVTPPAVKKLKVESE